MFIKLMKNRDYFWGEKKQFLFTLTYGIKEVFGVKRRKFGKIASRAIFLLSLVK